MNDFNKTLVDLEVVEDPDELYDRVAGMFSGKAPVEVLKMGIELGMCLQLLPVQIIDFVIGYLHEHQGEPITASMMYEAWCQDVAASAELPAADERVH